MFDATISLFKESHQSGSDLPGADTCCGIWIEAGSIKLGGIRFGTGDGIYLPPGNVIQPGEDGAAFLRFEVSSAKPEKGPGGQLLLSQPVAGVSKKAVLRLDSVVFPPAAVAYLHVHPGPGIRYLTKGTLDINSDGHVKTMRPGDCWFEDASSPMEATASKTETTQFVRAHILPLAFEGKPTIKYLRPADEEKPKLQENLRYFDQIIELPR